MKLNYGQQVRVLTMMVNPDIIHPYTSLKSVTDRKSSKLPGEGHHIIMLPIPPRPRKKVMRG